MQKVDDITYTSVELRAAVSPSRTAPVKPATAVGGTLILGGRKIQSRAYRGVQMEDIAAIWQSENNISKKLAAFNTKWDQEFEQFRMLKQLELMGVLTQKEADRIKAEYNQGVDRLTRQAIAERATLGLVKESGFSLDPSFNYYGLASYFESDIMPSVKETMKLTATLTQKDIAAARNGLKMRDADPLYRLLGEIGKALGQEEANALESAMKEKFGFQKARYDGDLQGTEVGMTLFYTDILAKLWGFDFAESSPHTIKDFVAKTNNPIAPIYLDELKRIPSTRIWFGPDKDRGFQVFDNGSKLCFTRKAARIFSASSNPFAPGVEVESNFISGNYITWWDKHYEEVARYEPEYERLNEIMKWSLLIGWLNEKQDNSLNFLATVPVNRNNWFPDWARKNRQLKFQDWDAIGFYERNYNGETTEAFPHLQSKSFSPTGGVVPTNFFTGGVSLAGKDLFKGRAARVIRDPLTIRPNVERVATLPTGKTVTLADSTSFTMKASAANQSASLTVIPKAQAKLRSGSVELTGSTKFERQFTRQPQITNFQSRAGSNPIGDLSVAKNPAGQPGFKIKWQSRDIDRAQALGQKISKSTDPDSLLFRNPDIEVAFKLTKENQFLVKPKDSQKWLKIALEDPKVKPSGGQLYVGDAGAGKNSVSISFVDNTAAQAELGKGGIIRVQAISGEASPSATGASLTLPTKKTVPLEITRNGVTMKGVYEVETATAYFRKLDLPLELRNNPVALGKTLRSADMNEIAVLAEKGGTVWRTLGDVQPPSALRERLTRIDDYIGTEQYGKALKEITAAMKTQGETPELLIRKAVARMGQGDIEDASAILRQVQKNDPAAFLDEVNVRIADSMEATGDFVVPPKAVLKAKGQGYELDLETGYINTLEDTMQVLGLPEAEGRKALQLLGYRRDGIEAQRIMDPRTLPGGKARFYVEDSPNFANLDKNPSLQSALKQIVEEDLGTVVKLQRGPIGKLKPTVVRSETDAGERVFKAVGVKDTSGGISIPRRYRISPAGIIPDDCNDDNDEDCSNDDEAVYMVIAKRKK